LDSYQILVDFRGAYGGPSSRDEIVRALKEALALVEGTARDAQLACAGLRVEVIDPGHPRERRSGRSRA
jgi:hypothetical protein